MWYEARNSITVSALFSFWNNAAYQVRRVRKVSRYHCHLH